MDQVINYVRRIVPATETQFLIPAGTAPTGPLLDALSATASNAFSTRLLRAAYAGSALQVRRSSDNTTQDIGFSSGDLDTAALAAFVGANNGFISRWYDQSTSATDLISVSNPTQPQIVSSGVNITQNGHVCAQGTNANATKLSSFLTLSQPITVAIVYKYNTLPVSPAGSHVIDGGATSRILLGDSNAGTGYEIYAGTAPNDGGTLNTSIHAAIALYDAANSYLKIDGSTILSGINIGSNIWGNSEQTVFNSGFTGSPDVNICELILFTTSALSAGDQALILASWQSYWGTP